MPKIRGIKPELWTDEDFVELSPYARLLWIGLWNHACDNGHLQDKSKQIKMRILPTDDVNAAELLREIEHQGLIERDAGWITIPNLLHHQKPHKRWFVVCDKPGCAFPDGMTYGYSKRESTVEQPLVNDETGSDNRCSTADVDGDGDVELMVKVNAPAPSRKKPAIRLPADWRPTPSHYERRSEGIDVDREAETFKAHAEANDRRCVNWNAAFTQWLLKARPSQGQQQQTNMQRHIALVQQLGEDQQTLPQIGGQG